jgi:hypothetical protein
METFTKLFGSLLVFVYHCFDRVVINGYLSGLSRPEQVVYFFRQVLGIPVMSKEILSRRTNDYRDWVESYARNHKIPIEWAGKGVRKEDYVVPALRRMERSKSFGVYFIFKSMSCRSRFCFSHSIRQGMTHRKTLPSREKESARQLPQGRLPRFLPPNSRKLSKNLSFGHPFSLLLSC